MLYFTNHAIKLLKGHLKVLGLSISDKTNNLINYIRENICVYVCVYTETYIHLVFQITERDTLGIMICTALYVCNDSSKFWRQNLRDNDKIQSFLELRAAFCRPLAY